MPPPSEEGSAKQRPTRLTATVQEIFGLSRSVALTVMFVAGLIIAFAVFWFFYSAPERRIIITAGAPGSSFETNAVKYRDFLAKNGIELVILPSQGSIENLKRLNDRKFHVDVGFVQGGITNDPRTNKLVSLGSINYEPLLVFYRSPTPVELISVFAGKRVAVGAVGSGTRSLALQLFTLNGIKPGGDTQFLDPDGNAAAEALLDGKADVIFLMGDTTSGSVMRKLETTAGIEIFDFKQADAYARRISYVNKLSLPEGAADFAKNIPSHDISLIGPTVEIIARPNLHPALSDLLIEAAKEVNGGPSLFKRRGEFPAAIPHDFPISEDATRYYTSGKKFFYKWGLPFWMASLLSRVVVVFIPALVVLIPAVRAIPAAFRWRMQTRINRWYRELLALERNLPLEKTPAKREKLMHHLSRIESEVNKMKVPTSFAGQFYDLRTNIIFVQNQVQKNLTPPQAGAKQ